MGRKKTCEAKERITFSAELHLKSKTSSEAGLESNTFNDQNKMKNLQRPKSKKSNKSESLKNQNAGQNLCIPFTRRVRNPDMSSCWLNACLQLILTAFDHIFDELHLSSELGEELLKIQNIQANKCIDPTNVKNIIVCAEDTRIALRKSELMSQIKEEQELSRQLRNVENTHLNLISGQQCVRDFFLCLKENLENWVDVYETFSFNMINSTKCLQCNHTNESEQNQLYLEMDVPPDGSNLSEYVEELINESCIVDYHCQDGCGVRFQAEKKSILKSCEDTELIIILLRRAVQGENGNLILDNKTISTDCILLR